MTRQRRIARAEPAPKPGIVHLGLGAFFRSHGALVIEEVSASAGGDWGIIGASLKSPNIRDQLAEQEYVYTAVEMAPGGGRRRIVNVISDVLFAPAAPDALVARMADPSIRIVSLTVTEKGYCHIPSTGALDLDHVDIRHDIENTTPRSAIGFIVRGLQARRSAGLRPFTVLSCDNLPNNGQVTRNVVVALAELIDPALAAWIAKEARFPSTMVDRIVPATTDQDIAILAAETGYLDRAPVFHEPFLQWVIEDDFVDGLRPQVDLVPGVQLVRDVAPFEHMKIRMLNGAHSALAYLGYLAGHETIAETVANPVFRNFIQKVWSSEIIPTLQPPEGTNLGSYAEDLLKRFANPAIRHRTWQIAMDGSQKLPQRIMGTLADNLAAGRTSDRLFLAVAAWMVYVSGVDEQGSPIDVRDPLAMRLQALSDTGQSPSERVDALLTVEEVFGPKVDPTLRDALRSAYGQLVTTGALESARAIT